MYYRLEWLLFVVVIVWVGLMIYQKEKIEKKSVRTMLTLCEIALKEKNVEQYNVYIWTIRSEKYVRFQNEMSFGRNGYFVNCQLTQQR